MARPERIHFSLSGDPTGATLLPLPSRRPWPIAIAVGVMFVLFACVGVVAITSMKGRRVDTVFDLMTILFQGFWALGWSVGVLILFLLTILFLFYRENAHITGSRLVHVPRLGPLRIFLEYDLAKIRNLRLQEAGRADRVRIRFEYADGEHGLGNDLPRAEAESRMRTIQAAIAALGPEERTAQRDEPERRDPPEAAPAPTPSTVRRSGDRPSLTSVSSLALIGANLIPLVGVVALGWDLGEVLILFWAENAVIGFYTLLKLGVVAKWAVLFAGPFFVGHYGGFMAAHFVFLYYLFVRGIAASAPDASAVAALTDLFVPLAPALLALVISHGISFYTNFLGLKEYVGRNVSEQMGEPYKRVVVLHVTIIFGAWAIMLLRSPIAALALLVGLKMAVDLRAHRREHAGAGRLHPSIGAQIFHR